MFEIRKAERKQLKARIWFFGNSWSWKTLWALLFAHWLTGEDWSKICVIDTEYGRSEAYADRWEFSVLPIEAPFSVARYIKAIDTAEEAGFDVIIIDSISHEWMWKGWILEVWDKMWANAAKWATLTPLHQQFIDRIQSCNAHVICCWRTKESIAMNKVQIDWREKTVIEKIPMKIETKAGFEFEMLISFFLDETHTIKVEKDNTGLFDGETFIIWKEQWLELREWIMTWKKVLSKIETEKIAEKELIIKQKEKVKEYSETIEEAENQAALDIVIKKLKDEVLTTEDEKMWTLFWKEGSDIITNIVKKQKEKFVVKIPKKTLDEQIIDLEFSIGGDQSQYDIWNEAPTDTVQFRNGQKKLYLKIKKDKRKLFELKEKQEIVK